MLTGNEIANNRLANQQLVHSGLPTPADVVAWMGAVQAQEYEQAKWAIGLRLPGSTEAAVEAAIQRADIVRTHLMRPTWHFVAAADIDWLLDLTAPHVSRLLAARKRELELDDELLAKSWTVLERVLGDHTYLTRDEVMQQLQQAGIRTDATRAYHLMFLAELAGVVCNGPFTGKKHTYALLRERVPIRRQLSRDEALTELAKRYFTSHGPATLNDFVWWSGLSTGDARRGIEGAGTYLRAELINKKPYWLADQTRGSLPAGTVHLLPAFDEFMVGYVDRSASLAAELAQQTGNGLFKPILVVDGQVSGLWKPTKKARYVAIELTLLRPLSEEQIERIHEAVQSYARYLGKDVVITP
ncbi:winged helix DNA-binding domain-containing protein [Fibrella sp. WM1]|uniref:winged helix DNA-binding domain-containing protein n=1 Tax=Fibrella musci TaxID=3242485 RepID=UPI0035222DFD